MTTFFVSTKEKWVKITLQQIPQPLLWFSAALLLYLLQQTVLQILLLSRI